MSTRLPSLESLRVFEASARHRNFSRAAKELCVSPAAVSLRVRDLEDELGQTLFKRNGPRIELTDAGRRLAAQLGEAMSIARSAVEECRSAGPVADEVLRITTTPTVGRWLAERLPRYEALADAARIRIEVSPDMRPASAFDIAIRSGDGNWPDMTACRLLAVSGTPMLSPELAKRFPLRAPEDLLSLPLMPDEFWSGWFRIAGVREAPLSFSPIGYQTQDMDACAALAGVGVALLSPALFDPLVREGKLVRPFAEVFEAPASYYLLTHKREERSSVSRFADWLRRELAAAVAAAGPARPVEAALDGVSES